MPLTGAKMRHVFPTLRQVSLTRDNLTVTTLPSPKVILGYTGPYYLHPTVAIATHKIEKRQKKHAHKSAATTRIPTGRWSKEAIRTLILRHLFSATSVVVTCQSLFSL